MAASRALHSHTSPQWHHVRSACFRHQLRSIKLANRIVCIGKSCPRVQAIGFSRCRHPRPFCTNGRTIRLRSRIADLPISYGASIRPWIASIIKTSSSEILSTLSRPYPAREGLCMPRVSERMCDNLYLLSWQG